MITLSINGQEVEVFQDEGIKILEETKNLQDIGALYAEVSAPMSIPATDRNNAILRHWYNLDIQDSINAHQGLSAELSLYGLDQIQGLVELISVKMTGNRPEAYNCVFYGKTTQIKALFGDDTFRDVSYGGASTQIEVSYTNVTASWTQSYQSGNVVFPVFDFGARQQGAWQYDLDPTNTNSIANSRVGSVRTTELRPAFRFVTILEKVFEHIGKTLVIEPGTFSNDLYLLPMERSGPPEIATNGNIRFYKDSISIPSVTFPNPNLGLTIDSVTEEIDPLNQLNPTTGAISVVTSGVYRWRLNAIGISSNLGSLVIELYESTNIYSAIASYTYTPIPGGPSNLLVNLYSQLTKGLTYYWRVKSLSGNNILINSITIFTTQYPSLQIEGIYQWRDVMPNEKINDFLAKMIKSENLILYELQNGDIKMERFSNWLENSNQHDITDSVDTMEITISKLNLPEKVVLRHRKSEDIANLAFKEATLREFGSLEYDMGFVEFTEGVIEVESPYSVFPVSAINKVDGPNTLGPSELEIASFYDSKLEPLQVPFSMWYYAGRQNVTDDWFMNNGSGAYLRLSVFPYFRPFSQRFMTVSGHSIAYGFEAAPNGIVTSNNLYDKTYKDYLDRIMNPQMRLADVTAYLESREQTRIKLNDTVVISGRAWKIEKKEYDSLTNKLKLKLYTYLKRSKAEAIFSKPDDGEFISVNWTSTPTPHDLLLHNVLSASHSSTGYFKYLQPLNLTNTKMIQLAQTTYKNAHINSPQLAFARKTTSEVYSVAGTFVTIDSFDNIQYNTNGDFEISLSTGIIRVLRPCFVSVQAAINYLEGSSRDVEFAILKNEVDFGFRYFGSKSQNNALIVASYQVDANDEIEIAVKTIDGGSADIEIASANFTIQIIK